MSTTNYFNYKNSLLNKYGNTRPLPNADKIARTMKPTSFINVTIKYKTDKEANNKARLFKKLADNPTVKLNIIFDKI